MEQSIRRVLLRFVEIALLIPAFGLLIPAVPSEVGESYPLLPGLAYATAMFSASTALTCWRGGEYWAMAVLKVLLFVAYGILVHERVWM